MDTSSLDTQLSSVRSTRMTNYTYDIASPEAKVQFREVSSFILCSVYQHLDFLLIPVQINEDKLV